MGKITLLSDKRAKQRGRAREPGKRTVDETLRKAMEILESGDPDLVKVLKDGIVRYSRFVGRKMSRKERSRVLAETGRALFKLVHDREARAGRDA